MSNSGGKMNEEVKNDKEELVASYLGETAERGEIHHGATTTRANNNNNNKTQEKKSYGLQMLKEEDATSDTSTSRSDTHNKDIFGEGIRGMLEDFQQGIEPMPQRGLTQSQDDISHVPGAHAVLRPNYDNARARSGQQEQQQQAAAAAAAACATENIVQSAELVEPEDTSSATTHCTMASAPFSCSREQLDTVIEGKIIEKKLCDDQKTSQRNNSSNRDSATKIVLVVLVVVLALVGAVVALVLLIPPVDDEGIMDPDNGLGEGAEPPLQLPPPPPPRPMESTTTSPTVVYPPFQEEIPLEMKKLIKDPTSSLYHANLWMLNDPLLPDYSPERQRQRFYLSMVYYSTNGDHWTRNTNWLDYNVSECDWYAQSSFPTNSRYYLLPSICNGNHSIVSLSLANNNLTGSLPFFPTTFLPSLQVLDLDTNHISGPLPHHGYHPELEAYVISNNQFHGMNIGSYQYPKLKYIKVDGNQLHNSAQNSEAAVLIAHGLDWEYWNSHDNLLGGKVLTELGLMTKLTYYARGNSLTGTLPSELGVMPRIEGFDVSQNLGLTGTLPPELGSLTSLTYLNILGTSIGGSIPNGLCTRVQEGTLDILANCSKISCCA